ncbi:MAG: flagellar hook-associated protein FlgK [Neomegalonema sp.]|nr:flagellar hook-associated protein FlgK [Neomegalonema sp.]
MTLNTALYNALSGLTATSRQVTVTAHNIANASTEGYARQSVDLAAVSLNGQGNGVKVLGVSRAQTPELTADRRRAEADLGRSETLASGAAQLTQLIGDSEDVGALFALYQNLEDTIRDLSNRPDSQTNQTLVVDAANRLAEGFADLEDGVSTIRQNTEREIAQQISTVNNALEEIAKLNSQISYASATGSDVSGLEQLRQDQIDIVAPIVPVEVKERANGTLALMTPSGQMLVDATASKLEFTSTANINASMDYRNGVGPLSGLSINGHEITPGASNTALTSGSLAGLFELRDVETLEMHQQIDALAEDLMARFADASTDPTLSAGAPGLFTDAGGASTGTAGLAGRLRVNAAVDPDQGGDLWRIYSGIEATSALEAGDNSIAVSMLDAMTRTLTPPAASGLTVVGSASDFVADLGSLRATTEQSFEASQTMVAARVNALSETEIMQTGVDIDYELQNLTTIETNYAANARVISVVDEMLARLMEI